MKHKKIKLGAILLLGTGLAGIKAQSTLYVREQSGTQTPYLLTSIKKVTFPAGNITVNKTDGTNSIYTLGNIDYLSFNNYTAVSEAGKQDNNAIILYPNPVTDKLTISYESIKVAVAHLEIIDVRGKIIHQQTVNSQKGKNQTTINISHIPQGIYVCRVQTGNKIESIKFLKQL